jgi:GMP synthase (glutamine-hydrolysing)
MVTERAPWMLQTEAWLRRAADAGKPILGVCFGHQMLAMAFGGTVGNHPMGTEVGTALIALNDTGAEDALFSGIPKRFAGYVAHTQSVLKLPETAVCLGGSDYEPHHIIRWFPKVYGVQFHPEFTDEVIENSISRVPDPHWIKRFDAPEAQNDRTAMGDLSTGQIILKRFMQL